LKTRPLAALSILLVLCGALEIAATGCASFNVKTRKGVYHTVQPGETLWRICHTYDVNMQTVCRFNDIDSPESIQAGQALFIPGANRRLDVPPPPREIQQSERGGQASSTARSPSPRSGGQATTKPSEQPAPSRKSRPGFIWPVKGPVTSWFGVARGRKHDGIDIAVPKGTPVRASEAGKVIYSGDGISGYGNLVIIQHPGGFTSVYAHNRRNLVRVDQPVKKGQIVAEVGKTGRADGYHLHFEIRYNAKPVDPMRYLP